MQCDLHPSVEVDSSLLYLGQKELAKNSSRYHHARSSSYFLENPGIIYSQDLGCAIHMAIVSALKKENN